MTTNCKAMRLFELKHYLYHKKKNIQVTQNKDLPTQRDPKNELEVTRLLTNSYMTLT